MLAYRHFLHYRLMEVELFSKTLEPFSGVVENESLQETLKELVQFFGDIQVLSWDEWRIAVPLTLAVDIPPLGTHHDIDIRDSEPVILVFHLRNYPYTAPTVFTDRSDFPKNRLAHLYIAKNGRPPAFCYVRGDRDGWYSNKRIQDLVIRISNWLRDAAEGNLTQDGNQFEPMRLEGYSGALIYDYDKIAEIVNKDVSLFTNEHLAIGMFEWKSGAGFRLVKMLTLSNIKQIGEEIAQDDAKSMTDPDRKHYRFGYFLWSDSAEMFSDYDIAKPESWGELKELCKRYSVNYETFENFYTQIKIEYIQFPLVVAIKRPKQVIGFSSDIEFLNFQISVNADDVVDGKISDAAIVKLSSHNQPLTVGKAGQISGMTAGLNFSAVVFGCGALGSKIALHWARCGLAHMMLIDPDHISPHNMVRHALTPSTEGQNKARALAEVIRGMYPVEDIEVHDWDMPNLIFRGNGKYLERIGHLFDFTASDSFFSRLVMTDILNEIKVRSAYISDFGNLGILLQEGPDRNPRVDDLKAILCANYRDLPEVGNWLVREQGSAQTNLTIAVGVGCNSETTILSDDKVSLHAAIIAGAIKKEVTGSFNNAGRILLSVIQEDNEYGVKTIPLVVRPLDIFPATNDPSWSVRFVHGVIDRILATVGSAGLYETGGVFVGVVNYKTKSIHVTDLISAPPDSKANPVCFMRGYQGLPNQVEAIEKGSGGQLGYVGEWHSHPHGPEGLSHVDMAAVSKFKTEFGALPTPLPVFLTVVTPSAILPYVF